MGPVWRDELERPNSLRLDLLLLVAGPILRPVCLCPNNARKPASDINSCIPGINIEDNGIVVYRLRKVIDGKGLSATALLNGPGLNLSGLS
jgi:hypothetical protein